MNSAHILSSINTILEHRLTAKITCQYDTGLKIDSFASPVHGGDWSSWHYRHLTCRSKEVPYQTFDFKRVRSSPQESAFGGTLISWASSAQMIRIVTRTANKLLRQGDCCSRRRHRRWWALSLQVVLLSQMPRQRPLLETSLLVLP